MLLHAIIIQHSPHSTLRSFMNVNLQTCMVKYYSAYISIFKGVLKELRIGIQVKTGLFSLLLSHFVLREKGFIWLRE